MKLIFIAISHLYNKILISADFEIKFQNLGQICLKSLRFEIQ